MSAADPDVPPPAPGSAVWWIERQERLGRRRPRASGLTIERIVAEALDLVDDEGLDALTVRGLAARLSTGSATLYRHVASRDELLVLLVDHVIGEVELPAEDLPAETRVVGLATGLRAVLLLHPNLVPALPAAPLLGPNALRRSADTMEALTAAGFSVGAALTAYLVLLDYVLGSVFFDSARFERHGARLSGDAERTAYPVMAVANDLLSSVDSDRAFEVGLQSFIGGLHARFS